MLLGRVEVALLGHGGLGGDEGRGRKRGLDAGGATMHLHEKAGGFETVEVAADRGF